LRSAWAAGAAAVLAHARPQDWGLARADAAVNPSAEPRVGTKRDELPDYRVDDVRAHDGKKEGVEVWVTYKEGVYDVTDFVQGHPGGDQILLAAGGPVEPFWKMFPQHDQEFVYELLEEMRVGNLVRPTGEYAGKGQADGGRVPEIVEDPYANDPERHPALIVRSAKPFNGESPPGLLVATQLTPNEVFYVRNHLPVPVIDPNTYKLEVCGPDGSPVATYSLKDLKEKFPKRTVTATVQCAGNRRDEMSAVKKVKGGSWDVGAISNAEWSGVRLRDVLNDAGIDTRPEENDAFMHLVMEGLDADPLTKQTYGASIPRDVFDRVPDVLLAYEMNGSELPRDHGYPIRAIAPGIVGARNVKWLGKVAVSSTESSSHWQQYDYKGFCPSVDSDTVDYSKAPAIQELPVVSAICTHCRSSDVEGSIRVDGYAWSGDGKGVVRVDVSADGGKTWTAAHLLPRDNTADSRDARRNRVYDWTRWTADVSVPKHEDGKSMQSELVCKAVDSAYNTQPERVEGIWNLRGVLNNAWHRVHLAGDREERQPSA
jgi:sulfite oxidase